MPSPGRRQAIIWTSAGILLTGPLETNVGEILIEIRAFSFKKMHLKLLSAKWQPFRLGLNVLKYQMPHKPNFVLMDDLTSFSLMDRTEKPEIETKKKLLANLYMRNPFW